MQCETVGDHLHSGCARQMYELVHTLCYLGVVDDAVADDDRTRERLTNGVQVAHRLFVVGVRVHVAHLGRDLVLEHQGDGLVHIHSQRTHALLVLPNVCHERVQQVRGCSGGGSGCGALPALAARCRCGRTEG